MSASALDSATSKVHFVTLGCPKNRVDSEIMLGHLQDAAFEITPDPDAADVIVVNTCGFIEDAKRESIDVILEMAGYKQAGRCRRLIVAGCLVQRYSQELAEEIPEIDHLLGNGEYQSVAALAGQAARDLAEKDRIHVSGTPSFLHDADAPRVNTFLPHSAYVKIAEGCDQKCTFCIIPKLRGLQRSRPIADIVREAEALAARGVVEINLVAQDTTGYGHDLEPKAHLAGLLRALGKVRIPWVRLHYAYPRPFSKALLGALAESPNVLPYLDMPIQHIADPVLARMKRGRPRRFVEKLLADIRRAVPGIVMRTSFIVGFPGETDDDFRELCEYVEGEDFERAGVFKFSREEGTPSHGMDGQVPPEVIEERHATLMEILQEKSREKMASYVGKRLEVLVDGPSEETDLLLAGRHRGQAPEIDGTTYINDGAAHAGDIVELEVTESFDYDLVGRVVRVLRAAPPRPDHPRLEAARANGVARAAVGHPSLRVLHGPAPELAG